MSNSIIHKAYESTVTSPTEMSVLFALADQANDDGICWPSVGSISRRTRLNERTVQKALRRLAEDHHISITGRIGGGYGLYTPTYVVHPVPGEKPQDEPRSPVNHVHPEPRSPVNHVHPEPRSPVNVETHGVNVETRWGERGDAMGRTTFTQTLIEPTENPQGTLNADVTARMQAPEGTSVLLDVDPLPKKSKGGVVAPVVEWDGVAFRVPPVLMAEWQRAYPAIDVPGALRTAAGWVMDNPSRGAKKQWGRFLSNWLRRTRPGDCPAVADGPDPLPPPAKLPAPDGWERAWEAMYGDPPNIPWEYQIDCVQLECRQWLAKHERGAA